MVSPLASAVNFCKEFGLFDVVLPFLLVFAIIFAILEKTRILGTEKIDKEDVPRRNLNTIVAFVIGMLVIATNKIVTAINQALPNVVLLAVFIICFLMLIGSFYKTGEFNFTETHKGWVVAFGFFILIGIILIFADAIKKTSTQSYLDYILDYVINNMSGTVVTSVVFLIVAIGAVVYATKGS